MTLASHNQWPVKFRPGLCMVTWTILYDSPTQQSLLKPSWHWFKWRTLEFSLFVLNITFYLLFAILGLSCIMQDLSLQYRDSLLVAWASAVACGILVPRSGIKPMSPALQSGFLTPGPAGKSLEFSFYKSWITRWSEATILTMCSFCVCVFSCTIPSVGPPGPPLECSASHRTVSMHTH